ncbi:MAG: Flp pilus assembly complex ATPase component TadA [Chloroflexi bacterium]|nr:Flp pilus assembly complex ATPase component TadA [Chloroflexota bacterium]
MDQQATKQVPESTSAESFSGEVDLCFTPGCDLDILSAIYSFVKSNPDLDFLRTTNSWADGPTITVLVEKPVTVNEKFLDIPVIGEKLLLSEVPSPAERVDNPLIGRQARRRTIKVKLKESREETARRHPLARRTIGQMLLEAQLIDNEKLSRAHELQRAQGVRLEQVLVGQKYATQDQVAFFLSLRSGVPFINLTRQKLDPDTLASIGEDTARKYEIIPVEANHDELVLATDDPWNIQKIKDLEAITKKKVQPIIGTAQDIQASIVHNYRASAEIEKQLSQIPVHSGVKREGSAEARISAEAIAQAPVVRAIDLLITQAVRDRASDVHVEPQEDRLRVRFRIDGILHEMMLLPLEVYPPLVSRLKIMAGMNIAERRRPQDGQISFRTEKKEIDIRVATSNTVHGEMVVLRILDKTFAFRSLPELGFLPETLDKYRQMLKAAFGMILISGPTGSGKTTTLYASVNTLDSIGTNIITIEDPVEYRFKNISQMQVNPGAKVTFATGLRATMRLDPDVILVGEIRDTETAGIAVQAALTGHLVLSSVHANDSVGVIFRLIDLGVERFLIASAVIGIVAQRMVRCICPHCSRTVRATVEEQLAYEGEMGEKRTDFLSGNGCNFCANTGYFGRSGIFEVLQVSEEIRRLILKNASADEIRARALEERFISLWRDGMVKVKMGLTTPYEIIRNVYSMA